MTSIRRGAAAALALLVLLTGCGGSDDGADDSSDSGDSSASADSGFAELSGDEIADAAKADMQKLEAVHYEGEIGAADDAISLDIQASSSGDCQGSIGIGDGTAELRSTGGSNWFRPDEAFWRAQAPDQADQIIATIGDKWVLDTQGQFAQFCDLDAFFENVFSDDEEGETPSSYEVSGTDEVDDQEVVKVEKTTETGTSTGYVVIDEPHYLVLIERTDDEQPGQVSFSEFDEEFEVEAPADDEVIDLDALQQQ